VHHGVSKYVVVAASVGIVEKLFYVLSILLALTQDF
jgi:hypothetical protein